MKELNKPALENCRRLLTNAARDVALVTDSKLSDYENLARLDDAQCRATNAALVLRRITRQSGGVV